jgi:hypothetical protein
LQEVVIWFLGRTTHKQWIESLPHLGPAESFIWVMLSDFLIKIDILKNLCFLQLCFVVNQTGQWGCVGGWRDALKDMYDIAPVP